MSRITCAWKNLKECHKSDFSHTITDLRQKSDPYVSPANRDDTRIRRGSQNGVTIPIESYTGKWSFFHRLWYSHLSGQTAVPSWQQHLPRCHNPLTERHPSSTGHCIWNKIQIKFISNIVLYHTEFVKWTFPVLNSELPIFSFWDMWMKMAKIQQVPSSFQTYYGCTSLHAEYVTWTFPALHSGLSIYNFRDILMKILCWVVKRFELDWTALIYRNVLLYTGV